MDVIAIFKSTTEPEWGRAATVWRLRLKQSRHRLGRRARVWHFGRLAVNPCLHLAHGLRQAPAARDPAIDSARVRLAFARGIDRNAATLGSRTPGRVDGHSVLIEDRRGAGAAQIHREDGGRNLSHRQRHGTRSERSVAHLHRRSQFAVHRVGHHGRHLPARRIENRRGHPVKQHLGATRVGGHPPVARNRRAGQRGYPLGPPAPHYARSEEGPRTRRSRSARYQSSW